MVVEEMLKDIYYVDVFDIWVGKEEIVGVGVFLIWLDGYIVVCY